MTDTCKEHLFTEVAEGIRACQYCGAHEAIVTPKEYQELKERTNKAESAIAIHETHCHGGIPNLQCKTVEQVKMERDGARAVASQHYASLKGAQQVRDELHTALEDLFASTTTSEHLRARNKAAELLNRIDAKVPTGAHSLHRNAVDCEEAGCFAGVELDQEPCLWCGSLVSEPAGEGCKEPNKSKHTACKHRLVEVSPGDFTCELCGYEAPANPDRGPCDFRYSNEAMCGALETNHNRAHEYESQPAPACPVCKGIGAVAGRCVAPMCLARAKRGHPHTITCPNSACPSREESHDCQAGNMEPIPGGGKCVVCGAEYQYGIQRRKGA